jgi:microcystin-dependent protein
MKLLAIVLFLTLIAANAVFGAPYVPPKVYAPLDPVLSSDRNTENARLSASINNIDPATQIMDSSITSAQIAPGGISIDNLSGTITFTILGTVTAYTGDTQTTSMTSAGWFLCDGRTVSSATLGSAYAAAYALLGTRFGPSTASILYIPDLRGRVIVGYNPNRVSATVIEDTRSARALGDTGGVETHKLTTTEMPSHNHGGYNCFNTTVNTNNVPYSPGTQSMQAMETNGSDGPHTTMPPYIVMHQIIYLGRP